MESAHLPLDQYHRHLCADGWLSEVQDPSLPLDQPDLFFTEEIPLHANSPLGGSKTAADYLELAITVPKLCR